MNTGQLWDMPILEFHPVNRALIGPGAYELIGVEAEKLGFKKTLLMTSGIRGTGLIDDIVGKLEYKGIDVVVYDKIESNPKDYNVMDGYQMYTEESCDSFISVGGGSSHDATKGCRVVVAHDGRNINEFEGFNKSENPVNPPHIAVSTTAGTGSETSWAYVITDTTSESAPHKWVGFDDASVCTLAINDPVLYYDLPERFTAQCGFDVLAHASEPYVSRLNLAASLGPALYAIKLTAEHLRTATYEPRNFEARRGMMHAQYIAAQAFNSGGLGIIHSISHAVSAFYDSHHGLNNAIALPRVWEFNMPTNYERFADIAEAMGVDTTNMTKVQAAEAALEEAIRLLKDLEIPENFASVSKDTYPKNIMGEGVYKDAGTTIEPDDQNIDRITNHVLGDACTPGNPRECYFESVRPVVKHCVSGTIF
ncbi:MAG TPA: NDMA-dependent methanol dehydrogenase [Rubrobacteraceae bacterium]|nr:NDMA-dependent methanol dehydrogenase [Rubrobacteraceae bacterium]